MATKRNGSWSGRVWGVALSPNSPTNGLAYMYDAYALTTKGNWVASGTAANWQLSLYNQGV
jgi:hypothetical protein